MKKLAEIDFSSLDPREIGLWPLPLRILVAIAAGCLTIVAVHFAYLLGKVQALDTQHQQEETKRIDFKDKYNKAINLDAYEQQMDEINTQYNAQLAQMPRVGNIPELLNYITKLANKNALKIESIRLGEPIKSADGFYENMQLDLAIIGNYHNIGKFLADLSKLSRIVTLHDFTLKPHISGDSRTDLLYLTIGTKTYWLAPVDPAKPASTAVPAAGGNPAVDGKKEEGTVEVEEVPAPKTNSSPRRRPGSQGGTE